MITIGSERVDYTSLFGLKAKPIVGIGVTAFNRIFPGLLYPNYSVVCYKDSSDLEQLATIAPIKSIQKDFSEYGAINRLNSLEILQHKGVEKYLNSLGREVGVFLYRTTRQIDRWCQEKGWHLVANSSLVRDRYEDKRKFFKIGREIGLPMIPGEQYELSALGEGFYEKAAEEWGSRFVLQLTDFTRGGGKGTFFISSPRDFRNFLDALQRLQKDNAEKFTQVNLTRFVEGVSASITGCVTRHGVLSGVVQTQVIDVPELVGEATTSGMFCGHDWSFRQYSARVQKQAEAIVQRLGSHMFKGGYKGIFGVDLIVDVTREDVFPVECNPRYTGAFPVYSMLQKANKEVPLDAFQLLELLDLEYKMDFEEIDRSWKREKRGAHLVLNNLDKGNWLRASSILEAGVYRLEKGSLTKVGPGVMYEDISNEDEFVLADGTPRRGQVIKPGLRFGKLIFKRSVIDGNARLNEFGKAAVEAVNSGFEFIKEDGNE